MTEPLHIQRVLREHGIGDWLKDNHIKQRRGVKYPNLVSFKYDLFADFRREMVRECRGIVLDENDNWNIVSRGFDKFFNYGEPNAATIDWSSAWAEEKCDGSLCVLYHYDDSWHVATTGTPDAAGKVHGSEQTFADYFWKTFLASAEQLVVKDGFAFLTPKQLYTPISKVALCFCFELMGPANRIVVEHHEAKLRLLAVRNRVTGEYLPRCLWPRYGVEPVRARLVYGIDELIESFDTMSPFQQEGYVIVDHTGNRIKLKHPKYVELHHAKSGLSDKALLRIAITGESAEVAASFPELKQRLDELGAKYYHICDFIDRWYQAEMSVLGPNCTQKEFASRATKSPWPFLLFDMRRIDIGANDALRRFLARQESNIDKVLEMVGG